MSRKLEKAKKIIARLRDHGFDAMIVGGAVRDHVMGKDPKDFDIATSATPEDIEDLFFKTLGIGKDFGVMLVLMGNDQFEVATFRKDLGYSDGRRPDSVQFADAKVDVLRRDFTINGLFWNPDTDEIVDFVGGVEDIQKKIVRTIGNPYDRFEEDRLRILRAIRFASNLGFEIEPETWKAVCYFSKALTKISKERIRVELEKILTRPFAFKGIVLIKESNMDFLLCPAAYPPQVGLPSHLKEYLGHVSEISLEFSLAMLYGASANFFVFESGKLIPVSDLGIKLKVLKDFLKNMTFSNQHVDGAIQILKMTGELLELKNKDVALLRLSLGHSYGGQVLKMLRIMNRVHGGIFPVIKMLEDVEKLYQSDILPKRIISGDDLKQLGFEPGKRMGNVLERAYRMQLGEDIRLKEKILERLKEEGII